MTKKQKKIRYKVQVSFNKKEKEIIQIMLEKYKLKYIQTYIRNLIFEDYKFKQ